MNKERKPLEITELDVQPIAEEDLAAITGGTDDTCGCIVYRTDNTDCDEGEITTIARAGTAKA